MSSWVKQVFFMELRKRLAYRSDFWINFFGQTFFSLAIAYYLWDAIFASSGKSEMNGFTIKSMVFYYLVAPLVFRIQQGHGIGFLSQEIYQGSLNKYLLYPISVNKYKFATYIATTFFFTLQLFLILIIYQIFFFDPSIFEFNFTRVILFLLALFISSSVYFFISLSVETFAFWHDNIWSLGVVLRFLTSFLGGALIPLTFFPEWGQEALKLTPFPYLIDFPVKVLTQTVSMEQIIISFSMLLSWTLFFYLTSQYLWKKGNLSYTGVGI